MQGDFVQGSGEIVTLVSELPDGFGSNANLIFAHSVRKELGENLIVPQRH